MPLKLVFDPILASIAVVMAPIITPIIASKMLILLPLPPILAPISKILAVKVVMDQQKYILLYVIIGGNNANIGLINANISIEDANIGDNIASKNSI